MTLKREALSYATNGFDVFPLAPGCKTPLRQGWQGTATRDPEQVDALWTEAPEANIGVRSGGGTLVLDTDSSEARRYVREIGVPETTTARTPRGGQHLYLEGNARNRTNVGVRGLDVRGRGGYVVGVGSRVGGRRYEWEIPPWDVPPQPAPPAVLELVRERARSRVVNERPIPEGQRNVELTRIAGWFVAQGVRGATLSDALNGANRRRCRPPLTEKEVERIVKSANGWTDPPLWMVDPLRFTEDSRLDVKARWLLNALASRARHDGTVNGGRWLEAVTGMSRHSLYRAASDLETCGRLCVRRSEKRSQANVYRLLPFEPEAQPSGMGVATCDIAGAQVRTSNARPAGEVAEEAS